MRLAQALLCCFAFTTYAKAGFQYTQGWSPGQPTRSNTPSKPDTAFKPGAVEEPFTWSSLLTKGPLGNLFARGGINISETLAATQQLPWDDRVTLITDQNYGELILYENFTSPKEEEERVWFLFVTTTANQRAGVSAYIDEQFDEAHNISLIQGDLPHVRWGRIDYLAITKLTTKWGIWRAPVFVIAKNQGKSLRFLYPQQVGSVKAEGLHAFMLEERWSPLPVWTGPWAPGGSREELLDKLGGAMEFIYGYLSKIPNWMLIFLSGMMGTLIIRLFHRAPDPVSKVSATVTLAPPLAPDVQKDNIPAVDPPKSTNEKEGTSKHKGNKK